MYGRWRWRTSRSSTLAFRQMAHASEGVESESDGRRYAAVPSVCSYLAKMGEKDGNGHDERLALRFPRSPGK
jgi:hypothetical protein